MLFIDRKTLARYDEDVHGDRTIWVPDPNHQPTDDAPEAPLVQVANPNTKIPADADLVEIDMETLIGVAEALNRGATVTMDGDAPVITERTFTDDDLMAHLRVRRDALLRMSDGNMAADAPQDHRNKWGAYRQALRNWPTTVTDPKNPPPFPAAPV